MKMHSYSDVITNSSTEMFVVKGRSEDVVRAFYTSVIRAINSTVENASYYIPDIKTLDEGDIHALDGTVHWWSDTFVVGVKPGDVLVRYEDNEMPYGIGEVLRELGYYKYIHLG